MRSFYVHDLEVTGQDDERGGGGMEGGYAQVSDMKIDCTDRVIKIVKL